MKRKVSERKWRKDGDRLAVLSVIILLPVGSLKHNTDLKWKVGKH